MRLLALLFLPLLSGCEVLGLSDLFAQDRKPTVEIEEPTIEMTFNASWLEKDIFDSTVYVHNITTNWAGERIAGTPTLDEEGDPIVGKIGEPIVLLDGSYAISAGNGDYTLDGLPLLRVNDLLVACPWHMEEEASENININCAGNRYLEGEYECTFDLYLWGSSSEPRGSHIVSIVDTGTIYLADGRLLSGDSTPTDPGVLWRNMGIMSRLEVQGNQIIYHAPVAKNNQRVDASNIWPSGDFFAGVLSPEASVIDVSCTL